MLNETKTIIEELADRIKDVRGVSAVVLGGSRAIGTHTEESDIDIGIYYDPADPLDLAALGRLSADFDDEQRADALTPIGGWGPWINGDGWLTVRSVPVDFLYRDLRRVSEIRELTGYVIKQDNY
jgi:predicted nucleotidyltransferase